tara:strand:- start:88 stop:576 length:489 start_codon:yes stop_codon:yes gene_type:complete
MKIPKFIEFHNETNSVLSRYLKEAAPEEGCAILIGQKRNSGKYNKQNFWEIKHIWNCRNIWGQQESRLVDENNQQVSKSNRFEIDAKDQIAAQKWARKKNLEVLCFAHSHPQGKNKPSKIDLSFHNSPGLMVISNSSGNLKAWWIKNELSFQRVKIEIFSLT